MSEQERLCDELSIETEPSSCDWESEDQRRCRLVEEALFRRARGYVKRLKKSVKVKRIEFDAETGKKLSEREELETGIEEEHIPADLRVCAYYLNNRDPSRWREHPVTEEDSRGAVDYPAMAETTCLPPDVGNEEEAYE